MRLMSGYGRTFKQMRDGLVVSSFQFTESNTGPTEDGVAPSLSCQCRQRGGAGRPVTVWEHTQEGTHNPGPQDAPASTESVS